MTVEELLSRFDREGDALAAGGTTIAYRELLAEIERRPFPDVPARAVVGLVGDFDVETIASLLSLWRKGCVVVPMLAPNAERDEIAQVEYVVKRGTVRSTGWIAFHPYYESPGGPGLVLFTSGSTGTPKAAVHDVSTWLKKLSRPGRRQRTVAFLSFDHVGGLNTLLYALANGGCVIVPADRSPAAVWSAIDAHEAELLPTTPTFLRLALLDGPIPPASSLKLVAYGSEPMPETTLAAAKAALPNVELLQQYGMSELGVMRSRSREDGSTWVRLGGPEFGVRVVDGLLEVKADTAMLGYLNAPSPFTADGWLRTGDEAEQDGEYLRIKGRRSETINVGGEKVHPAEVEASLEALEGVTHAAVRGESNPITGQIVVAAVRLSTDEAIEDFRKRMRIELKGKLPRYALPQRVEALTGGMNERGKKIRSADAPSATGARTPRLEKAIA